MADIKRRVLCFLLSACLHATFAQYNVTFSLTENTPEGHHVGNVSLESNLTNNISQTERNTLHFTFLKQTQFTAYFTLDDVTGDLNTSSVLIDRETICGFTVDCVMEFEIAARASKFFGIINVRVVILDVNDNAPTFPVSHLTLNISEGETIGTVYRIKGAFDSDMSRNNSIQGHTLEQSDQLFELTEPQSFNDSYELKLTLIKALDRETKQRHFVQVIARDGGNPVLSGTLNITVIVLDDNDNSPVFEPAAYAVHIDENIELFTVFLTLSATDKDAGRNAEVSYRISERQSNVDTIKGFFNVSEVTGEVSVIKKLVNEPREFYQFIVEAVDHGEQPQSSTAVVKVTVNDVENNPPSIDVNLLSPGNIGFVQVNENEPVGYFVAHVNVEDNDKGANGDFTCRIENDFFKLEKYYVRGFKVVVSGSLDREEIDSHNVTIVCEDSGNPKLTSSESFLVLIGDVNDHTPKFDSEVFAVNIQENNEIGETVTRVIASDLDIDENGRIEYSLSAESGGKFLIDKNNGTIYANKSFDREEPSEVLVVFRVFATDHGETPKTGTATVSVSVTDENDNAPRIIPVRPELRVVENQEPNTMVGFLNGTDKDLDRNGKFKFAFAPISKTFPFTIDASGEIRTTKRLDREQQSRYDIPVTITDLGVTALSNTQYITIYVGDENDNVPKVTFPNELNYTVKFVYPVKGYNVVTTVAAYDIDDGENSSLAFSIIEGNELGIFEIDSRLGEVSAKSFIDIQKDTSFSLKIRVQDKGKVPQSTEVNLVVELIYANGTEAVQGGKDSGNKNIIIVIIVVITTVAIAIAIIGIILFLRSMDPRKRHAAEDDGGRYSDSGISSRSDSQSLPPEVDSADDKAKKRKEVSFSLDFSMDGLDGGRNKESNTDDMYKQISYPNNPNQQPTAYTPPHQAPQFSIQKQEKIDSHMKALKLQQYLWEAKSRDWEHQDLQQLPFDSESETSRETVTCDSGRGGSVDDVSTTSPTVDEKKRFSFTSATKDTQKRVSFLPQSLNHHFAPHFPPPLKESTPLQPEVHSYGPQSFQKLKLDSVPLKTGNQPKMGTKPTQSKIFNPQNRYNPTFSLNMSDPWRSVPHRNDLDPMRMRHDSFSSIRSNEDDGGSTTTSGSYTLDQDEIDTEVVPNYGHLVV